MNAFFIAAVNSSSGSFPANTFAMALHDAAAASGD
jgi:hypothetical protein